MQNLILESLQASQALLIAAQRKKEIFILSSTKPTVAKILSCR
jgi:hypothetical protein